MNSTHPFKMMMIINLYLKLIKINKFKVINQIKLHLKKDYQLEYNQILNLTLNPFKGIIFHHNIF